MGQGAKPAPHQSRSDRGTHPPRRRKRISSWAPARVRTYWAEEAIVRDKSLGSRRGPPFPAAGLPIRRNSMAPSWRDGEKSALDELTPLICPELANSVPLLGGGLRRSIPSQSNCLGRLSIGIGATGNRHDAAPRTHITRCESDGERATVRRRGG